MVGDDLIDVPILMVEAGVPAMASPVGGLRLNGRSGARMRLGL